MIDVETRLYAPCPRCDTYIEEVCDKFRCNCRKYMTRSRSSHGRKLSQIEAFSPGTLAALMDLVRLEDGLSLSALRWRKMGR